MEYSVKDTECTHRQRYILFRYLVLSPHTTSKTCLLRGELNCRTFEILLVISDIGRSLILFWALCSSNPLSHVACDSYTVPFSPAHRPSSHRLHPTLGRPSSIRNVHLAMNGSIPASHYCNRCPWRGSGGVEQSVAISWSDARRPTVPAASWRDN